MPVVTYEGIVQNGHIQLCEPVALPEGHLVYVVVPPLDEDTARRKANRWLIDHVGNMMMAHRAQLVQTDGPTVWRFGAFITAPSHPPVGPTGYIDVDATTGDILADEHTAEEMIARGTDSSYLARASLSAKG